MLKFIAKLYKWREMEAIKALQELIKKNEDLKAAIVVANNRIAELDTQRRSYYILTQNIKKIAVRGDAYSQESQLACKSIYMLVK